MNTNPNKPSVKKSIANTLYIFLFNKIGRLLFFPMELKKPFPCCIFFMRAFLSAVTNPVELTDNLTP